MEEIIDEMLNNLEDAESRLKRELDSLCDDCNPVTDSIPLEYAGAPCFLISQTCEPGGKCYKNKEYNEISRMIDIVRVTYRNIEKEAVAV